MTVIERSRIVLRPNSRQRMQLESLFAGPVLVAQLLRAGAVSIQSPQDASMFLLRNRNALEPYLWSNDREASVEHLKSLVIQWSSRPPEDLELSFESDCSISVEQQVFLPIPRLGLLEVANASHLAQLRIGSRYVPGFGLFRSQQHFSVNLVFWRHHPRKAQTPVKGAQNKQVQQRVEHAVLSVAAFLTMFDNRVNQQLMHELRVSQQHSTTKFHELEGRPVQGGLPSLGKRR